MTSSALIAPTITGSQTIDIDGRLFGVPHGSRVVWRRRSARTLVYVMTPSRDLHALVAEGEVVLDEATEQQARERYFSGVYA